MHHAPHATEEDEDMTEAAPELRIRQPEPAITIIDIDGDVTPASEEALMGAYGQAGDARAVILNFSGLDYMNSGGIGLLVTLLVRARRQKQQLLAYGLTSHYRQIFELTRLDDAIGIHDDEAAALAAAGAAPVREQETVR
jgi:anti-sigma B factor antagonist